MRHLRLCITASSYVGTRVHTNAHGGGKCKKDHTPSWISGLYEFTCILFGLFYLRLQFLPPHRNVFRDQQFVTMLLSLDMCCVCAGNIDEMLVQFIILFKRLKDFNLKVKPKKCHCFSSAIVFMGYILFAEGISVSPNKVEKLKTAWFLPMRRKYIHSWDWYHISGLFPSVLHYLGVFTPINQSDKEYKGEEKPR